MARKFKLTHSTIDFALAGLKYRWEIVNNLPETHDTIGDALENYLARTPVKKVSPEGFCDYINDKQVGYFAITKEQFEANQI